MLHKINTVVLADTYRNIFHYELLLCGILLVCALDFRFGFFTWPRSALLRIPGWILRIAAIAFSLTAVFFFGKVIAGSMINTADEAENVLVLGMALENGKPTKDLLYRIETAADYWEEHPQTTLILTGGNPDKSGLTEAGVMRDLLTERGIPEESMILEDRAASTRENFINSANYLNPEEPVILISSNYHMDRAIRMAGEAGFTDVQRLPALSDPLYFGANVMWEVILDINELSASL